MRTFRSAFVACLLTAAFSLPASGQQTTSGGSTAKQKQVSGGVLNGKATYLPRPNYPPAAVAVGAAGAVSVQVLID